MVHTADPEKLIVGVFGNSSQDHELERIVSLIDLMSAGGIKIRVESSFAAYLKSCGMDCGHIGISPAGQAPKVDMVVSIGGDGTFLQAVRWIGGKPVPVLGVNTGHLGYLAPFSLERPGEILDALRGIGCRVEMRMALQLEAEGIPSSTWPYALNEVAVLKEETASMLNIATRVGSRFLADYRADGIVVATPTGSTGYNLSVGGPILQPTLEAVSIAPIAPHSLTLRPITIGADSVITMDPAGRGRSFRVSLDGHSFTLPCGTQLKVSRAPFCVPVIMRSADDFAATLRTKLFWGHQ